MGKRSGKIALNPKLTSSSITSWPIRAWIRKPNIGTKRSRELDIAAAPKIAETFRLIFFLNNKAVNSNANNQFNKGPARPPGVGWPEMR